jgi:hypothetical protein
MRYVARLRRLKPRPAMRCRGVLAWGSEIAEMTDTGKTLQSYRQQWIQMRSDLQ